MAKKEREEWTEEGGGGEKFGKKILNTERGERVKGEPREEKADGIVRKGET